MGIFDSIKNWGACAVPYHEAMEVCVLGLPDDLTPLASVETPLTIPCGDWLTMMYDSAIEGRQFNKYRNSKTGEILWTTFREDAGMYGADKGGVMGSAPLVRTAKQTLITIQHTLIDLGYGLGAAGADGICGAKTKAAIRSQILDSGGQDIGSPFASIPWTLFDEAGLGIWHWENFNDCLCQTNECMNVVPTEAAYPPEPVPAPCRDFTPIPEPGPTPPDTTCAIGWEWDPDTQQCVPGVGPYVPPTPPTPPQPPTAGKMSLWPLVIGGVAGIAGGMLYQDSYAPSGTKMGYAASGGAIGAVGGLLIGLALPKQQVAGFYRSYYRRLP